MLDKNPNHDPVLLALADLSAAVGAGFERVDERFVEVDDHLNKIDRGLLGVDDRFGKLDGRLVTIDNRLGKLENGLVDVHSDLATIHGQLDRIEAIILKNHEERLHMLEGKLGLSKAA